MLEICQGGRCGVGSNNLIEGVATASLLLMGHSISPGTIVNHERQQTVRRPYMPQRGQALNIVMIWLFGEVILLALLSNLQIDPRVKC